MNSSLAVREDACSPLIGLTEQLPLIKCHHREGLHDISAVPFYFWRRFMTHTQELDKALNELKRITGVSLNVSADTPEEEEQALTQVRCLCTAYREKYNKNDFLQSLMMNGIPSYRYLRAGVHSLHIAPEEKRTLFLLETRIIDDTVMAILKNLLSVSDENLSCPPVNESSLAILRPVKSGETPASMRQVARMIVDTTEHGSAHTGSPVLQLCHRNTG